MSAITTTPTKSNFLSPLGFRFNIKRTPGLNYFVQSANIPGTSIGTAVVGTPFVNIPYTGVKNTFEDLVIAFKVDEELRNYKEIFDWMMAISFPDNFTQHAAIANANPGSGDGIYSDATLTILNSVKHPIVEVNFKNLFPYDLSELKFSTTETDINYIEVAASFKYQSFTLNYLI
jgi:hypothetical protein